MTPLELFDYGAIIFAVYILLDIISLCITLNRNEAKFSPILELGSFIFGPLFLTYYIGEWIYDRCVSYKSLQNTIEELNNDVHNLNETNRSLRMQLNLSIPVNGYDPSYHKPKQHYRELINDLKSGDTSLATPDGYEWKIIEASGIRLIEKGNKQDTQDPIDTTRTFKFLEVGE